MKKRLLSLLMAVLMLVSLVPAVYADSAATATEEKHTHDTVISIKKDADKKTPGVEATICEACNIEKVELTPFVRHSSWSKHECKTAATMVVQEATCHQVGLTVSCCAECGKEFTNKDFSDGYYNITPKLECVYSEFVVYEKPTCQVDGWGYAICKLCNTPIFVKDADDAVKHVKSTDFATLNEYNARYLEVYNMFVATNPGHALSDKLVAVTKEMEDVNGLELKPASKPAHVATVNDEAFALDLKTGEYANVAGEATFIPGYTGDKICPVCGVGVQCGQEITHNYILGNDGEFPGKSTAGKSDSVKCEDCTYVGGERIAVVTGWYADDAKDPTCTTDGKTATYMYFDKNGDIQSRAGSVVKATGHDWAKDSKDATCTEDGYTYPNYRYCTKCGAEEGPHADTDKVKIACPGHKFVDKEFVEASCTSNGLSVSVCSVCGAYEYKEGFAATSDNLVIKETKGGNHVAADTLKDAKDATCKEPGYTGDKVCKFCGEVLEKGEEIKVLEHKTELKNAKDATCAAAGYTGDEVCTVCGEVVKKGTEIAKGQHKTELKNVKDATCTAAGYSGDEVCTVCGETVKKGEETALAAHKFANGVCTVCGAKDTTVNPFKDVNKTTHADYYDAILWGYYNGVVKGTNNAQTLFSPEATCTRAQIVTFLYRAEKASPVTGVTNPFTDVSATADKDYYDAIMWAVKNGIVEGTSATTFDPYATCTRAQIVTMLYRLEGEPAVTNKTVFTDLTDNWYINAVNWAFNLGIAQGTGNGAFSPDAPCTRAQTITFIYRYYNT